MLKNFNAVTDKWIPVITDKGIVLASLEDVFDISFDGKFFSDGAWGGLPYLNLLMVIATDACRPQQVSDIQSYLDDPQAFTNRVRRYLSKNKNRFNLFDRNPFLQIGCYDFKTLSISKPEHIRDARETLLKEGNTTTELRGEIIDNLDSEAKIIQALLKSLVYGCNKKTLIPGNARPKLTDSSGKVVGEIVKGQPEVSPIRTTNSGSSGTLNFFVKGNNLIQTVVLNMIPEEIVKPIWPAGFGFPIYLQDTDDHNVMVANHEKLDQSFLGHIVPLTKYLRIFTDEEVADKKLDPSKVWVIYSHAVAYDFQGALTRLKESKVTDNTFYGVCKNPKAKYTRGILLPNSYLWKEFAGFDTKFMPKVLDKFKDMTANQKMTVYAVGMEGTSSAGLVYNEKIYESSLTFDVNELELYAKGELPYTLIHDIGKTSSDISYKLYKAVIAYAKEIYGSRVETDPYTEDASRKYWQSLNKQSVPYVSRALKGDNTVRNDWEKLCRETAQGILKDIKDGSVRRNKAIAKALLIVNS